MKRFTILLLPCILMSLASCSIFDNFGYPGKIVFTSKGGTKCIEGEYEPYTLEITNYDGYGNERPEHKGDTIMVTHLWLTAKTIYGKGGKVYITAEPNHTGHGRTLYVSGMMDDQLSTQRCGRSNSMASTRFFAVSLVQNRDFVVKKGTQRAL